MSSSKKARTKSLRCTGDPKGPGPVPVLLVHGTAVTALENWGSSYFPALVAEGHAVCTVTMPEVSTGDLQRSIEYVATAIRTFNDAADRPISVLGHSQGAFLPRIALKVWPDLTCARRRRDRSRRSLRKRFGSLGAPMRRQVHQGDAADGHRIQVVACAQAPSVAQRAVVHEHRHAERRHRYSATCGEQAARSPSHPDPGRVPGPGDPDQRARPHRRGCRCQGPRGRRARPPWPGRSGTRVRHHLQPGLLPDFRGRTLSSRRCRSSRGACTTRPGRRSPSAVTCARNCADVKARGRLIESLRTKVTHKSIIWSGSVPLHGHVRVSTRDSSRIRRVRPGNLRIRVKRPTGRGVMTLETRPDRYSAWARESVVRMASRRR